MGETAVHHPEPEPAVGSSVSHAAAVSKLPSLFILGRCCLSWAQLVRPDDDEMQCFLKLLAQHPEEPFYEELLLPPVQQWLQASSTQEQLGAAGYAAKAFNEKFLPQCQ
jgi:hypothetical protein